MDTTDGEITFDENGVCDHCRTYRRDILPHWDPERGDEGAVETLVERIRSAGRGRDFDCIIGMSGGADSSYLTYCAKEKFGLRPLVFHVDAGWNTQIAVNNIERIIDGLGLDLYTEVIDWAEMRDLQLAFFKSGVPHIDTPQDHAFFATMYKFAEEHKVGYVLTGCELCYRVHPQSRRMDVLSIGLDPASRHSPPLRHGPSADVSADDHPQAQGLSALR